MRRTTDNCEQLLKAVEANLRSWLAEVRRVQAHDKLTSRIEGLLNGILSSMYAKIRMGELNPHVTLNLLRTLAGPARPLARVPEGSGWTEIAVLGTVGNPITWGHLVVVLGAFEVLHINVATMLIHGAILHKPAEDAYPESARLSMAKLLIVPHLEPFVRFCDFGSGPESGKTSEEVLHKIFDANRGRRIALRSLTGFEGWSAFQAKLVRYYQHAKRYRLEEHADRQLTIHVLGRLATDEVPDEGGLNALSARVAAEHGLRSPLRVYLHPQRNLDLGTSSTDYRRTRDARLVPAPLHRFIVNELWLGSINKIGKKSLQPGFYQAKITAFFYLANQAKP